MQESVAASGRLKKLLLLLAATYLISFTAGYVLVDTHVPLALSIKEMVLKTVTTQQPFTSVLDKLMEGNLVFAIILTLLINLSTGAFLTTTAPGVIPILGALMTMLITFLRGFVVGVSYHDVFSVSPFAAMVASGTAILELGAYVLSGAAGINISLSTIYPKRYQTESRWAAFKEAWKDTARLYVAIFILLLLAAIWEMTGIFVTLP